MFRRLLHAFAGSRPPDHADDTGLAWRLLPRVRLVVMLQSDDDDRPLVKSQLVIVLHGHYRDQRLYGPGSIRFCRRGRVSRVGLLAPRVFEDKLLILPWMHPRNIITNSRKQVWLLIIG